MFELLGKTNIDFLGKRRYAFALSGVLVLLGVLDRKSTRLNSSHIQKSRMPSSA